MTAAGEPPVQLVPPSTTVAVRPATPADADQVQELALAAFAPYASLDPPSGALHETVEQVAADIAAHGGYVALAPPSSADRAEAPAAPPADDPAAAPVAVSEGPAATPARIVAALRLHADPSHPADVWLRRVCVAPDHQGVGVGSALVTAVLADLGRAGWDVVRVGARILLPANRRFWERHAFVAVGPHDRDGVPMWTELAHPMPPATADVATAAAMHELGRRLSTILRAGDLVVLDGELGAGKTTLAQGVGAGLGTAGPVLSPTFVIAREHQDGRLPLVHVDAYRLGSAAEIDDLDLDSDLTESVTLVEWGRGLVEGLASDRLEVAISADPAGGEVRQVTLTPVGVRWAAAPLRRVIAG